MLQQGQVVDISVQADPGAGARALLAQVDSLTSFDAVAMWDAAAGREMESLDRYLQALPHLRAQLQHAEAAYQATHQQRPWHQRLFKGYPERAQVDTARQLVDRAAREIPRMIEELQAAIDKTPNNRAEQKEMLEDLRDAKKELALQKREINQSMREIRSAARQRTAQVDTGLSGLLSSPRSRRWERVSIRLAKESAIGSHESVRDVLERQILGIDRLIAWVSRIK